MPGYLVTCRGMTSRRAGERARSHLVAHRGTPPLSLALAVFPVTITAQRGLLRAHALGCGGSQVEELAALPG